MLWNYIISIWPFFKVTSFSEIINFSSFLLIICFKISCNVLLKHFYKSYFKILVRSFQHLIHLCIGINWLPFIIQVVIFLILGIIGELILFPRHLSSYNCRSLWDLFKYVKVKVTQSCPTLCNPVNYTVRGILQARILEWVAFTFYREYLNRQPPGLGLACGFWINFVDYGSNGRKCSVSLWNYFGLLSLSEVPGSPDFPNSLLWRQVSLP